MAQDPKQLKDFSAEVKAAVPVIVEETKEPLALNGAIEKLLAWEKKTRLAADAWSTAYVAQAIIKLCGDLKQYKTLNEQIHLLFKRRAQLKKPQQAIVQDAMLYLDGMDKADKLELIDTLRTVSAGKIFVEIERARVTLMLSKMKEEEGNIAAASDTLQEIQVETVGSMEAPEKIDFLLQQMRLCLNNHDYVRTELTAEKVSKKLLNLAEHQARKLEYHRLMIRFYEKKGQYLDICKSYRAIFDTESVQQGDWQSALSHAAIFLLLAPFDYEVNDMLQRIKAEKKLIDLPSCLQAYQLLTTNELCAWPLAFEQEWLAHPVFTVQPSVAVHLDGAGRWALLRKRIVQHNIRVISAYYSRITTVRLSELLHLDLDTVEEYLSEMVSAKQLVAKIDRPAQICVFGKVPDATALLNSWSQDVSKLLLLVDESCHMINKEQVLNKLE